MEEKEKRVLGSNDTSIKHDKTEVQGENIMKENKRIASYL